MDLQTAFRIYSHKAPVAIPSTQRSVQRAYLYLEPHLLPEERTYLAVECSHSLHCHEGREKFDAICNRIEQRLFGESVS